MNGLRQIIALMIIGVLGIQTGTLAMHVQLPVSPSPVDGVVDERAGCAAPASQPEREAADHHCPACSVSQSCFPVGQAAQPPRVTAAMLSVVPPQAAPDSLPSPRHETLLRPPRSLG